MRLQETRLRETILSLESLLESIKKVNLQCKSWGFELDVVKGPRAQLPKQSVGLLTKIGAPQKQIDWHSAKKMYMKGYTLSYLANKYKASITCVSDNLKRIETVLRARGATGRGVRKLSSLVVPPVFDPRPFLKTGDLSAPAKVGEMSPSCKRVWNIIQSHTSTSNQVMSYSVLRKLCSKEGLSTMAFAMSVRSLETRKVLTKSDDLVQIS